jgi:hypothetical protein
VALEPFLYYVFQTAPNGFLNFSSAAYALNTGSMMALLAGMMYAVIREEAHGKAHRLRKGSVRNFKVTMVSQAVGSALFLVSAFEIFWVSIPVFGYLRFLLWYIALGTFFASRGFSGLRTKRGKKPQGQEGTPPSTV